MFYVYAIASSRDGRIYVGLTQDLDNRVREHNSGKTRSTRSYRPWKLFYEEKFNTRTEGRNKEKKLKSGCGKEFLKKILKDRVSP